MPIMQYSMPYLCSRIRSHRRAPCALACASLCVFVVNVALASLAVAEESTNPIGEVRVGFNGVYKVGFWTPVEVELLALPKGDADSSSILEIVVPDGDGVPSQISRTISDADRTGASVRALVKFGRVHGWMHLRIRQGGEIIVERRLEADPNSTEFRPALPTTSRLVVCVGSPLLADETRRKRGTLEHIEFVQLANTEQLPERWFGYTGVDSLVMTTSWLAGKDVAASMTFRQAVALEHWVELGGQLVLSVGSGGGKALASESPLSRFAPGKLQQVVSLPLAASFETFVGAAEPLQAHSGDARPTFSVARLAEVEGDVELAAQSVPLIVRKPRSFGSVVFVAVDMSAAPFSTWSAQPELIARVLRGAGDQAEQAGANAAPRAHYDDLSSQLRAALDQFEGVAVFPRFAGMIFGLIAIYGLIIGPLDYLVVRRLLGRSRLTWVTFPLFIAAACGAAYALVGGIKGREAKINQVDVVDIDAQTGVGRGTSFTHAYSPASGEVRYDIGFRPRQGGAIPKDAKIVASWMGLPGRVLGGMDPSIRDTNALSKPYDFAANLDAMTGVPIAAASSKSFIAQWRAEAAPPVVARLRATRAGSLFQDSSLAWNAEYTLPGAYLLHDRWVYRLGDMKPGDVVKPAEKQRRSAASKFRRHRQVDGQEVPTPFDLGTLDTLRVVEAMLFHEAAGGASYTAGLENRYLSTLDMSGLLRNNVAILVGQPKDAILDVDFQPAGEQHAPPVDTRHWTILRIVLPVEIVER